MRRKLAKHLSNIQMEWEAVLYKVDEEFNLFYCEIIEYIPQYESGLPELIANCLF